jgi:hypothetical protein
MGKDRCWSSEAVRLLTTTGPVQRLAESLEIQPEGFAKPWHTFSVGQSTTNFVSLVLSSDRFCLSSAEHSMSHPEPWPEYAP